MPEPILMTIAAALATKAATGLYDVVKEKFRKNPRSIAALEAAAGRNPQSPEVDALATILEQAERDDPQFSARLRAHWAQLMVDQHAESGGVTNSISGNVSGKVIQAGDIHGNISF